MCVHTHHTAQQQQPSNVWPGNSNSDARQILGGIEPTPRASDFLICHALTCVAPMV